MKTAHRNPSPMLTLELIWAFVHLFPHWTPEQRLANIEGLLDRCDMPADYPPFHQTKREQSCTQNSTI